MLDMTTADGKQPETFAYDSTEQDVSQSKFIFSREAPKDQDWEVWENYGADTLWRTSNCTRSWEPGLSSHTENGPGSTMKKPIVSKRGMVQTQNFISQQRTQEQDLACNMSRLSKDWKD